MNDEFPDPAQLGALKEEHRALDERIRRLTADGSLDQLEIARLKKRKLQLKDRIERIADISTPDIIA